MTISNHFPLAVGVFHSGVLELGNVQKKATFPVLHILYNHS
jgi:hypothetical protein